MPFLQMMYPRNCCHLLNIAIISTDQSAIKMRNVHIYGNDPQLFMLFYETMGDSKTHFDHELYDPF